MLPIVFTVGYFLSTLKLTTAVSRFSSQESLFDNRDDVFEKGWQTFQDNVWLGHGLDKYEWTDPKYWDKPELMLQPHNAYLALLIMYGLLFGAPLILSILYLPIKTFKTAYKSTDPFVVFCYLLVIILIIKGFSESLLVGVNDYLTVLFWIASGVILVNHSSKLKTTAI
jgi:O-antigen ligase